jgi:hypothetical protein
MADLVNLADVKQWLGVTTIVDDAVLGRLVAAASGFVEIYLGRRVLEATFDESYDGTGGEVLALPLLPGQPITAVLSLMIDARAVLPRAVNGGAGYRFDANCITLDGDRFTRGRRNVALVYRAGFAVAPPEIAQACIELAALRYRERDRIGHVSKSVAGETVSFSQKDMPAQLAALLAKYQRVVL